jgi:hypothetical protein
MKVLVPRKTCMVSAVEQKEGADSWAEAVEADSWAEAVEADSWAEAVEADSWAKADSWVEQEWQRSQHQVGALGTRVLCTTLLQP